MSTETTTPEESLATSAEHPVLSVQGVVKRFGSNIVLRRLDLDVHRHEVVVLLGASGSGKSTLLRCANLLERVDARKVHGWAPERATKRGMELLERIGLAQKAEEYPDRLSGGQQQRVAIVRALATNPELLLLDEITSALDPMLVGEVLDLVREVKDSGSTILMATHEIGFARQVADRVVFLERGKIVEQGTPEEVIDNPKMPQTQEFLARVFH